MNCIKVKDLINGSSTEQVVVENTKALNLETIEKLMLIDFLLFEEEDAKAIVAFLKKKY